MKLLFTTPCLCALLFFAACSNDDVPDPVDCSKSTLAVSLLSKIDVTGCGVADGSISVAVSGGKVPYSISINGGASAATTTFAALAAGTHNVTVVDAEECERTLSVTLDDPSGGFSAVAVAVADNECLSDNGTITVNATGGTEPYMYKFGSEAFGTTNSFTGLKNGSYSIEVKDANDCPKIINAVVPRGDTGISFETQIKPILQANCIKSGCHDGSNGSIPNWSVFVNVKANAQNIKTRTGNGSMPQDQVATGGLPQNERDLIACWVDDGAKEN